jgi:predicted ribosomally synthesized peptide with SipW-like signal peptide
MKKMLLVAAAFAGTLMVGSAGAYFTAQAQVPENVIRAGTVAASAEPTASALSIEALAPGSVVQRPLAVVNDGALPVSVVLTAAKKAGIADFYDALTCRVTAGGTQIYDGALGALRTTPVDLAPGARIEFDFGVGLPATAGNDLAGDYAKVTVYVDAEQVH